MHLTDDAIEKPLCNIKFTQIEGNGRKFHHIQLINSVSPSIAKSVYARISITCAGYQWPCPSGLSTSSPWHSGPGL